MASIEAEQIAEELENDECDEVNNPEWRNQKKHIFVLSEAGKPIYTRYCSLIFINYEKICFDNTFKLENSIMLTSNSSNFK